MSPTGDFTDDIVADVLQRIAQCLGGIEPEVLQQVEESVRRDWGGERPYIVKSGESGRRERCRREAAILADYQRGERPALLAKRWGCSVRHVHRIIKAAQQAA